MNKIPIIIDVDTGCDDAIEIIQSTLQKELNVLGISCVAGNTTMDHVLQNTNNVLQFIESSIPVYKGCTQPLKQKLQSASFHGKNGLGDIDIPDVSYLIPEQSSIDFMAEKIMEYKREIVLLFSGPLTNAATLLIEHPETEEYIKEIVFMGGSVAYGGNVTQFAEFNTYTDPEAAKIVLESSIPTRMIGLDVTMLHGFEDDYMYILKKMDTLHAKLVTILMEYYKTTLHYEPDGMSHIHDVIALCAIVHPEFFTFYDCCVEVELEDKFKRGMTKADFDKTANCQVALDLNGELFWDWFLHSLEGVYL